MAGGPGRLVARAALEEDQEGSVAPVRNVRGSRNGSCLMKLRTEYLSSSLLWRGKGRGALWSRPGKGLPPASSTSTLFPAALSTWAAVPPPAPLPMMQKSKGSVRLRLPRTSSLAIDSAHSPNRPLSMTIES